MRQRRRRLLLLLDRDLPFCSISSTLEIPKLDLQPLLLLVQALDRVCRLLVLLEQSQVLRLVSVSLLSHCRRLCCRRLLLVVQLAGLRAKAGVLLLKLADVVAGLKRK